MIRPTQQIARGFLLSLVLLCVPAGAAQVTILAPGQHDTVHNNAGTMAVAVKVDPPLDPDEGTAIRILLDGKPVTPDSTSLSYVLQDVERGEHWLQALVVDRLGQTLSVSDTVYFTMWQASRLNPAGKNKP